MHHHGLGRQAAIDRALRRWRLHHGSLARPAGVTRPARDPHPKLRGHDIELLAARFADHMQRATTAGALAVLDVHHHLVARQVCRQIAEIALRRCRSALLLLRLWCNSVLCRLVRGDRLLQILEPQLQLVIGELLGAAAEPMAHQPMNEQAQLVILGIELSHDVAQHLLQRRGIVRQVVQINSHAAILNDAAESVPADFYRRRGFLSRQFRCSSRLRCAPFTAIQQRRQLRAREHDPASRLG